MTTSTPLEVSAFFSIVGQLGERTVSAELAEGRLTVDAEVWELAGRRTEERGLFGAAQDPEVVHGMLDDPGGTARILLQSLDEVTHATMGMEFRRHRRDGASEPETHIPGHGAGGGRCSICGSRDVVSEFHAGRWCPTGYRSDHSHLWCRACDHQWLPG